METAILGGLVKEIITSLGGFAYNEIAKVLGVKGEIVKLAESLKTITHELRDADQTIAHSEATDEHLKTLTEIAYEAESIIDRFKIKMGMLHTSQFQERSGSLLCGCCREVNTRCNVAKRIEKLNKRLEDMRTSRELRHVLQALTARYQRSGSSSGMIGPCHEEPNSVGSVISNDCNDHIRRLRINNNNSGGNHQSLFAIVGAPGVGKTALAQRIYREMRGEFTSRMWVHISSSTGNMTIWRDETLDREASSGPEQQRETVRKHLTGSNVLLVIDNVRHKEGWEFLGELGQGFLDRGVRVILTASHRDVTRMIGVDRWSGCHYVRALNKDDGWLLLLMTAQLKERDEAAGNFQDVGERIVRKCNGLPLAIKAVGSRLRQQNQLDRWTTELSTDFIVMHKEIRRSIDASYMELGYRLKLCFLYCSLYPEGSVIEQKSITQQWIAEGFFLEGNGDDRESTRTGQQGTCPEEARQCFTELVNRSLLVPTADGCATMPNLLRSYAIYRSQDENYVGDPRNIGRAFKVWRLYAADGDTIRDIPDDVTSLRTLLVFGSSTPRSDDTGANNVPTPSVMSIICRRFTSLRVLDLRDSQVKSVGSNLGRLLQLRYLNLSNTSITRLPREVKNLVMLQYLILKNCRHLTSLPMGVGCLKNLRTLDISETPELQDIQFRLTNLKELNCFQGFLPVSSSSASASPGWTFMELSNLSKLTSLQIMKLGSSTSSQEAAQLRLNEMSHLRELELFCAIPVGVDHGRPSGGDADIIGGVLGELKPTEQLTSLKLANFYGSELPSWVSSSHLMQLERLTLDGCFKCQRLPSSLGEMRNLKFLAITGTSALSKISHELRGAPINLVAFPRLEELIVGGMENLQTWSGLEARDMPLLRSFHLSECPKLSALPPWLTHCTALTSLKIQRADELAEIRDLPALKELQVGRCRTLHSISELSRLEDLEIVLCSGLGTVEDVPLLRSLRLHEHNDTMELPPWLPKPPFRLRTLEIIGSQGLLDRCAWEVAPCWPLIKDVADLVYAKVHDDGSVYFSYTRSTRRFRRSLQCWKHADAFYGATVQSIAHPPQEKQKRGDLQEAKAWKMWRALYGLVAAFLIGSAVILSTGGTRSSANGTLPS